MSRPSRSRPGFTLPEVLIALAILAMAATVLGSGYINVMDAYARAEVRADRWPDVAMARAALLSEKDPEKVLSWSDIPRPSGDNLRWRARLEPTEVPDLFDVSLEVEFRRPPPQEPELVVQRQKIFRPEWSKPEVRDKLRRQLRERIEDARGKP